MKKYVVIDTETTGLKAGEDEVLSLAIVDESGRELFNKRFRPVHKRSWPEAQKINGISWKDVKNEKELLDYSDELRQYFDGTYAIAGYNTFFDIKMLRGSGLYIAHVEVIDVMREFNNIFGGHNKLVDCAKYYGYSFDAHDALNDARATAYCYTQMTGGQSDDSLFESPAVQAPKQVEASHQPDPERDPNKKNLFVTIVLFLVSALFLYSGFSLLVDGNIGSSAIGLLIGAVLGYWGVSRCRKPTSKSALNPDESSEESP